MADFGVFEDLAAQVFSGGLEHGASEIVAVDIEAGKRLEDAAERNEESVELGKAGGRLGINEGGAPAVRADEFDEVVLGLCFDAGPEHAAVGVSSLPADEMKGRAGTLGLQHLRGSEWEGIGDFAVVLL